MSEGLRTNIFDEDDTTMKALQDTLNQEFARTIVDIRRQEESESDSVSSGDSTMDMPYFKPSTSAVTEISISETQHAPGGGKCGIISIFILGLLLIAGISTATLVASSNSASSGGDTDNGTPEHPRKHGPKARHKSPNEAEKQHKNKEWCCNDQDWSCCGEDNDEEGEESEGEPENNSQEGEGNKDGNQDGESGGGDSEGKSGEGSEGKSGEGSEGKSGEGLEGKSGEGSEGNSNENNEGSQSGEKAEGGGGGGGETDKTEEMKWDECCNDKDWSCCKKSSSKNKRMSWATGLFQKDIFLNKQFINGREIPLLLDISSGRSLSLNVPVVLYDCFGLTSKPVENFHNDSLKALEHIDFYTINSICDINKNMESFRPFIMLQNPVIRVIEDYHERINPESGSFDQNLVGMEFHEYIKTLSIQHDNFLTRTLSCNTQDKLSKQDVTKAQKFLKDNVHVGVFIDYVKSVEKFQEKFKWKKSQQNAKECVQRHVVNTAMRQERVLNQYGTSTNVNLQRIYESNIYDFAIYLDYVKDGQYRGNN